MFNTLTFGWKQHETTTATAPGTRTHKKAQRHSIFHCVYCVWAAAVTEMGERHKKAINALGGQIYRQQKRNV